MVDLVAEPTLHPGHWAQADNERTAIRMAQSGLELSYGEVDELANKLSHWLVSLGLGRGDHVAFCMENRLEYLAIMWGCHYAGVYYTAISSRLNVEEVRYILNDCGARAFIVSPAVGAVVVELVDDTPQIRGRLCVGGTLTGHDDFDETMAGQPTHPLEDRRETTDMLYSSGTTGRPKGVKALAPDEPLGSADGVTSLCQGIFAIDETTIYLSPGPLYHAAPLRFCRAVLRLGGMVVVMERFDAEEALAAIETHRITASQWVPTMFLRMLKLPAETRERYDVSSLTSAIHAAAPCPISAKEQMIAWWGPVLHEYYAGTEGNGLTYCNSEQWLAHKGTVGRAVRGELHIVDDDGNDLPVGDEGGVYFSGAGAFEYHNDPAKTADSRLAGGLSTLGDIGRIDEDGYLYLTDRRAFMIISGGVNIYPQEAENVLSMHPEVLDVAVFGVPNDDFGEEVKAVVHPVSTPENDEAARVLERTLITYCRERLADIKCPRTIDFRSELPRHPTGKLYKRLLKDEYWQKERTES